MKPTAYRLIGIVISLCSALWGLYWVYRFVRSGSPDSSLLIAPLFFFGLPLTFIGNMVGSVFLMAGKGLWYCVLPTVICYFLQWQLIGLWFYRKGTYAV
jgi:hypothetical protein